MPVYRFKVYVEDKEDVYREIEIRPAQTFEDFHLEIQKAFLFDDKFSASFFTADNHWRRDQEIVLKAEDSKANEAKGILAKTLMKKAKLAGFIEDPHQRFIYHFESEVPITFLVELVKIFSEDVNTAYPRVSKSVGVAPKQYKKVVIPPVVEDEDDDEEEDDKSKDKIFHASEEYDKEGEADHDDDNETASELNSDEAEEGEEADSAFEEGLDAEEGIEEEK